MKTRNSNDLKLRTLKKAAEETGASLSFFKQLVREGKLTRYKINTATYVSLTEFQKIATPSNQNRDFLLEMEQ